MLSDEKREIIHCIGDSHVSFFSGGDKIGADDQIPFFRTYWLGPVLAFNLCKYGTRTRGREHLFEIVDRRLPKNSIVLMCFGEIDCRVHLQKEAMTQAKPVPEVVFECAKRYCSVILEVKDRGHRVVVWNAVGTAPDHAPQNPEYPHFGTMRDRNIITHMFNEMLKDLLTDNKIPFISIFDSLVGKDWSTRTEYYQDNWHLSQRAMPLALEKLNQNT